jgi:hypothetical protein
MRRKIGKLWIGLGENGFELRLCLTVRRHAKVKRSAKVRSHTLARLNQSNLLYSIVYKEGSLSSMRVYH